MTLRCLIALALACFCSAAFSATGAIEPVPAPGAADSSGCGIPQQGSGRFLPLSLRVGEQERTYHLLVPADYDAKRAYPLIFRWHGYGGDGLSGGLGIEKYSKNDAIVVAPDGLHKSWGMRSEQSDLMFFDLMLETVSKQYCVDRNRVFSYGFSRGAYFSNQLACERGDVLRASAAVAGGVTDAECRGKVAAWFLHDRDDNVVPIAQGEAARDRVIARNGCSQQTVDIGDGCVKYTGCPDTPVVWCESHGIGHNIRGDFAPERVWQFFQGFH